MKGSTMTDDNAATPEFAKGTWQHNLQESGRLNDRSAAAKKRAGVLLWAGATAAITSWLPNSESDETGEEFTADLIEVMGKSRKGDVSKIKTVALAVANQGLVLDAWPNLSGAYAEARRLTSVAPAEAAEDNAAEAAIEAMADSTPKTASTVEAAAKVLLSKGVDGAVVALLDALGEGNFDAHRSLLRSFSTEVNSRVSAAANAERAAKDAERQAAADKRKAEAEAKRAEVQKAKDEKVAAAKAALDAAKAEAKAKPKAKPKAESVSKGDPNKKALPKPKPKPAPVEDEPSTSTSDDPIETDSTGDDLDDLFADDTVETPETPAPSTKPKPVPVRR